MHVNIELVMNKEQAIEFIKDEINKYRSIKNEYEKSLQVGYVNGLLSAFSKVDLLGTHECCELHFLLSTAIISE